MKLPLAALLCLSTFTLAADAPRPNILYFYVDDMGWGSIGPNGQAERRAKGLPSVKTPNLDKLAAEGMNFTHAYGCTVCSPARSSQQTGFHQGHTFADRNDPDNAKKAIRTDDVTMGDALSAASYATGYWGKWGYGGSKEQKNPVIQNVQTLPTSHGYTHVLTELHHVRAHTFFQPTLWSAPAKGNAKGGLELAPNTMLKYLGDAKFPAQPSNHAHPKYPIISYCDDAYAFAALEFVRSQSENYNATKQPFFGLLAVQIPHGPFDEVAKLPGWDSAYADDPHFSKLAKQTQQWAAMVTRIDAHFGNILGALADPNGDGKTDDSVVDNTLVIFMSDNGGPGGKNNQQLDANGGLRGNKGVIYEGGIRVPTIMRWPGKIQAGSEYDLPVDVTDLLPTFCDLAGVETPLGLDGVSLAPILTGEGERKAREFLIHEAGKNQSIIRGYHKLVRTPKGLDLYNLQTDRAEKTNIANGNKNLVSELEALLLGERVDEPRGFANTYHQWTGKNGASASDPENWSDYIYENEGVTYIEEKGGPQLSWTATIEHRDKTPAKITADKNLGFLGLEIWGTVPIELALGSNINLTGRNEIRLKDNAVITVDGGTISSLRWIDVHEGATIKGSGKIDAVVYNKGTVSVAATKSGKSPVLHVSRNFHQSEGAILAIEITGEESAPLLVDGESHLSGKLKISVSKHATFQTNQILSLIEASSISGRFTNAQDTLTTEEGTIFEIQYRDKQIDLKVIKTRVGDTT